MDEIEKAKRIELLRKQAQVLVDNERNRIRLYVKDISSANIIRVAAGTNGYCGGDAGHGGQTIIEIEDLGCTALEVDWEPKKKRLEIRFFGDSELDTAIEAFEFIVETLNRQRGARR